MEQRKFGQYVFQGVKVVDRNKGFMGNPFFGNSSQWAFPALPEFKKGQQILDVKPSFGLQYREFGSQSEEAENEEKKKLAGRGKERSRRRKHLGSIREILSFKYGVDKDAVVGRSLKNGKIFIFSFFFLFALKEANYIMEETNDVKVINRNISPTPKSKKKMQD